MGGTLKRRDPCLAIAHLWVRLVTAPQPLVERQRRREEIRADVWDHLASGARSSEVLSRVLRGALHDVAWTLSSAVATAHPVRHPRGFLALAPVALAGLWIVAISNHRRGGPVEVVGTAAYWMFYAGVLALALSGAWWALSKTGLGRRR